ncbi:uncharacterized protein LOC130674917 [Microplitis mediator]|uniref:uncharacterized protein LOC130674917 n=1 Tax=Microplitis mediator TaxID=375433 RepID=UPI0025567084|nr:uncharacterized protein LOC130674917 [Microplitis mediator]
MIKFTVILFISEILVYSGTDGGGVFHYGPDERTIYGWQVNLSENGTVKRTCNGLFIGPQVFLTYARCVENLQANESISIVNTIYDTPSLRTDLTVKHENIYFGEYVNKIYSPTTRQFTLLITDQRVLPKSKYMANTFVKLAAEPYNVDYKKCFVHKLAPPIISEVQCVFSNTTNINDGLLDCYCDEHYHIYEETSLFCHYRKTTGGMVLAGYVISRDAGHMTVVNLSGLNITLMYNEWD